MNPTIYLHNGIILLDTFPRTYSRSLTIKGGLVVEIDGLPPDACQRIDLDGAFAMPGLIDSHLHLVQGSSSMGDCNLSDVTSKEQFASLLLEQSAQIESGQWLLGFGWTQETLGSVPDATWFPNECDLPMLCYRVDYHCAVLNEAALAVLPCDAIAKLTGGSQIANGIVKEDALYEGVGPHIPSMPAMYKQRKTQQRTEKYNNYRKFTILPRTQADLIEGTGTDGGTDTTTDDTNTDTGNSGTDNLTNDTDDDYDPFHRDLSGSDDSGQDSGALLMVMVAIAFLAGLIGGAGRVLILNVLFGLSIHRIKVQALQSMIRGFI